MCANNKKNVFLLIFKVNQTQENDSFCSTIKKNSIETTKDYKAAQ